MACMEVALKSSIRNSFLISNMHSGPQVFLWNHKEQVTSLWQTLSRSRNAWCYHFVYSAPSCPYHLVSFLLVFWLHRVFIAMHGLSLVVPIGSSSPLVVGRLLTALASSVVELRFQVHRLQRLLPMGSVVVAHRLSCPAARGIFPDQDRT